MFAMMPEFMLEMILDVLTFALKTNSPVLREINSYFAQSLLVFVCNSKYFNNPFLMSKIVDVIFLCCTNGTEASYGIFLNITRNAYAHAHLFPRLVKFYSDVETTGASNEFYDKFNIRRSIQVIFQVLWKDTTYRSIMIDTAK